MGNQQSSTEYRERLGKNKMVMDRLRRSLRESFRRRKEHVPECSKPHQWQADEVAVRGGTCNFQVKYLGCVEVFESRGMQVCEEALKVLRNSRRRPIKGTLYVTGDGLRVVDDDTKGLIVDQTIEKVSFCAPDRNHEKGFSYICRDGTTRRWMCHGFLAFRDSGERLSHAVGCAFAVCLEKKQKRDKDTVMMNFDPKTSTFTRTGSFRTTTMTEKLSDPQDGKPSAVAVATADAVLTADSPPVKNVVNPFAIERPHATPSMLQRQGSFRVFAALNQTSPFKRQLSLRVNDLPSTLERQRAMSLESADLFSRQNGPSVAPIPESSPVVERPDSLSAMCQQVAQGLSMLSSDDPFEETSPTINSWSGGLLRGADGSWSMLSRSENSSPTCLAKSNSNPSDLSLNFGSSSSKPPPVPSSNSSIGHKGVLSPPLPPLPPPQPLVPPRRSSPNFSHLRSQSVGSAESFVPHKPPLPSSTMAATGAQIQSVWTNGNSYYATADTAPYRDPFDAEWAAISTTKPNNTNPFAQNSVKTFEVQM